MELVRGRIRICVCFSFRPIIHHHQYYGGTAPPRHRSVTFVRHHWLASFRYMPTSKGPPVGHPSFVARVWPKHSWISSATGVPKGRRMGWNCRNITTIASSAVPAATVINRLMLKIVIIRAPPMAATGTTPLSGNMKMTTQSRGSRHRFNAVQ